MATLRELHATPHVIQNNTNRPSAIDQRATRHARHTNSFELTDFHATTGIVSNEQYMADARLTRCLPIVGRCMKPERRALAAGNVRYQINFRAN